MASKRSAEFLAAKRHLTRACRELKKALEDVEVIEVDGLGFTEEEKELLGRESEAAQATFRLFIAALTKDSDTDLAAELAHIERKRQWGPGL
jgi:hypothetical protein